MDEEIRSAGAGGESATSTALALAGASREEADAFLRDQRRHLHEQSRQIHLDVWEKRLGVVLRLGTAVIGIAIAGAMAFMVWQAAQSNGLRIQPFSVPPELVARGITGEVVAGRVLDQLNRMQAATNSRRASRSYASDWSQQGIKLDVPETGISLTELDRFLRDHLGNDIEVSGDVIAAPSGITLTVRAGRDGDASFSGPVESLPDLVHQAAEAIYRFTQPYRYSVYIRPLRPDESLALSKSMALTGLEEDRPWAFNAWGLQMRVREGVEAALDLFEKGAAKQPDNPLIRANIASAHLIKGEWEIALSQIQQAIPLVNNSQKLFRPESLDAMRQGYMGLRDRLLGNFRQAITEATAVIESADPGQVSPLADLALGQLGAHQTNAARQTFLNPPLTRTNAFYAEINEFSIALAQVQIESSMENWAGVLAGQSALDALVRKSPGFRPQLLTTFVPMLATAKGHLGRMAEAERDIAPTPANCDPCLIARAQLAEMEGEHGRADFWFARAVGNAPSIPFASEAWGRSLLARGKPDEAIAQFKLSNQKGPHFADALEGWGEALMAKNQSHLALAKFAEAEKYAPNWGRLHLKWGEALYYAGKRAEAKALFARAAQLDLTPSEKTELVPR
ncbi:MAG: hypothetical protein JO256_11110 [Alphaproteobacteria bacterium]|nr:hypothetical protein [Alphaproteobacteria bacterium]